MKKLRLLLISGGLLMISLFAVQPTAFAAESIVNKACTEAEAAFCQGSKEGEAKVMAQKLINALLTILGAIAVIVIVVGGIKYVTSDGDASRIQGAKNTILYAIIGLIIAILSYAIVNFIVGRF